MSERTNSRAWAVSFLVVAATCLLAGVTPARAMYDPHHGRWLQRDPIEYVDGLNLYSYVEGRPATLSDPFGLTFRDRGNTGSQRLWWLGTGQGGRGNQGMGSIQSNKPPKIQRKGCCCRVQMDSAVAVVERSYTGVLPGDQGIGAGGSFYAGQRGYVSPRLATALNAHEAGHVLASRRIHDSTIQVAENTAAVFKILWLCCCKNALDDCRDVLTRLIAWDHWLGEFSRLDTLANDSGMHAWETQQGGGPVAYSGPATIRGVRYDVVLRSREETEEHYTVPDYSRYQPPDPKYPTYGRHDCRPSFRGACR